MTIKDIKQFILDNPKGKDIYIALNTEKEYQITSSWSYSSYVFTNNTCVYIKTNSLGFMLLEKIANLCDKLRIKYIVELNEN